MIKVDCQWLITNMETYFGEGLKAEEARLLADHLESCADCRQEIQSLRDIDPLVKQLFRYRLEQSQAARFAQISKPRLAGSLGLAGVGIAVAAALVFALLPQNTTTTPPRIATVTPPPVIEQNAKSVEAPPNKLPDAPPVIHAKPDATPPVAPRKPAAETLVPANAPQFGVIDPAGYSTTLADYRGYNLLLGVWSSDRPQAAMALERVYRTFGSNTRVRILGVSRSRQNRLAGTTFPMVFNNGS